MKQSLHTTVIQVRGYECDQYEHVNNSVYLNYLEHARSEFLDSFGFTLDSVRKRFDVLLVVVRYEIDYRAPAVRGDELEIRSVVEKIGNRSCTFLQEIRKPSSDLLVTTSKVTWVSVDEQSGRAVSLPDPIREELGKYHNNK